MVKGGFWGWGIHYKPRHSKSINLKNQPGLGSIHRPGETLGVPGVPKDYSQSAWGGKYYEFQGTLYMS